VTIEISVEEKNNTIKRMKRIINEFENSIKLAENLYENAVMKGDVKIQKEIQKQIEKIKREEASLLNIILELGGSVTRYCYICRDSLGIDEDGICNKCQVSIFINEDIVLVIENSAS